MKITIKLCHEFKEKFKEFFRGCCLWTENWLCVSYQKQNGFQTIYLCTTTNALLSLFYDQPHSRAKMPGTIHQQQKN
jgi:hypothetical protein